MSFCIFNRGYAEALGIDVEAGQAVRLGTATGTFDTFGHTLTLTTPGLGSEADVYFARDAAFRRNVFGRRGWLDRVRLGLIDYDGGM